jgi:hypothetical protein
MLMPLDPFYNVRFEDGSVFHYSGDRDYLVEPILLKLGEEHSERELDTALLRNWLTADVV